MKFQAKEITADYDEFGILVIYLGGEENYLMIQYQDEYDDQEVKLGMNTYHIERDDQSFGGYGGVKNWALKEGLLTIELNPKGQENLKTELLEITFEVDNNTFQKLKKALVTALND